MAEKFANDFATQLDGAIDDSVTSIDVDAAAPSALESGNFRIRIDDEILNVTAGQDTTTWTVARGAEGTAAASHSDNAVVTHVVTAATLQTVSDHVVDTSAAHAASAISVADSAANFTGTDVEAVLAELQDNIDAGGGGGSTEYMPVPHDVLVPAMTGNLVMVSASASGAANMMKINRYVVRKTGTLKDVAIWCAGTSGNVRAAVYDVGVATTAVYTRLWDGSSTATGANQWINMGDPDLSVTAGDHLMIGVVFSDNTATFGRQIILSGSAELPASYGPAAAGSGITPVWSAGLAQGAFTSPSTISDATMLGGDTAVVHIITARVE